MTNHRSPLYSITRTSIVLLMFLLFSYISYGQVSLTNAAPTAVIDFSNTMQASVGSNPSTAYSGAGFSPNPTVAGRLNSNAWDVTGFTYGTLGFGGTQTLDDFARGQVSTGVLSNGIYAYTEAPGTVANPAIMFQAGPSDFAPGTLVLKIKNNGTSNLTQLQISYNLFVRNDEGMASSFNFSHSADNIVYQSEPSIDYTSPDVADASQWVSVGVSPSRSILISGINIAPNGFYYIRWSSNDVSGSGLRDEFGLDDITLFGTYGSPAPEINVTGYGVTILAGDMVPSNADGTMLSSIGAPTSTQSGTVSINYTIQNLGGLPLNISSVTITGANAADFTFFSAMPSGSINGVSGSTISTKDLTILFDPSAPGVRSAIISIFSNDSNESPYVYQIEGYGFTPVAEISLYGLTTNTAIIVNGSLIPSIGNNTLFSTQIIGVSTQTKDYKIRNEGTAQLFLTGASPYVTIGGANASDFTLMTFPNSGIINANFFTKTFSIKFTPSDIGIRTAMVSIANSDSDENPFTFLIQGNGTTPEIDIRGNGQPIVSGSVLPTFVNNTFFDYLNISTGIIDRVFTIQNNGTASLNVGTVVISGVAATDYSVITPPATSLAVGAATTFTIRFSPTLIGVRDATISIANNDLNENPYTFSISGYGLNYVGCAFGPIQTIAIQDFETVPATPLWGYSASGTSAVVGGVAHGISGDNGATNTFVGARSLRVNNGTGIITMTGLNTSTFSDVELNIRVAAMSATNTEGLDNIVDRVLVATSIDNGVTWSNELQVVGRSNSVWSFSSGIAIASKVYTGTNSVTIFGPSVATSAINYQTTEGFSTIVLSSLPKVANLILRLTVVNDNAAEFWAIDNVTLFGRREVFSTWNNGTGWDNGIPVATVKAIINSDYNTSTNGSITACKCEVNVGKSLTIASNTFVSIESNFDNKGVVLVENNGSLVQRNDFAVNAGLINVKRFTTPMLKYDYTYWSSPVQNQTLFNLSPLTSSTKFFQFNTLANGWQSVVSSSSMAPAKGYIVRAPENFSTTVPAIYSGGQFTGQTNNGFIQTPIVNGASVWNLIGNPYPSAINADLFLGFSANLPIIDGTIYLWTHNTPLTNTVYNSNDYASYNRTGGVGTAASTPGNTAQPTGKIASGQGFFVKALASGQATFNNSMRLTGFNMQFFRAPSSVYDNSTVNQELEKHRLWLNLTNTQGAFKQTLVGYIATATNGIDRNFDGGTLNGGNAVSFYSLCEDSSFVIQGRQLPFNSSDIVPLGYGSTIAGDFSISIESYDGLFATQDVYLEDKLLTVVHDLKASPYTFITAVGTFNDRFELRYTNTALETDDFSAFNNSVVVATPNPNQISITSAIENMKSVVIYDILGRIVYKNTNVNASELRISDAVLNQQALIVKITLENGQIVTRKIVL